MIFLVLIYMAFISLGLPDSLLGSSWPIMNIELSVPIENAGLVSMIVSAGTIISSLTSHRLIHMFGTGKITVISVLMTAVALLGFSFVPNFLWLMMCAVPLGLGAGSVDSGLNEFVAEHYTSKHMNWLHCFWGIGAMLGPILISELTKRGGTWRDGYLSISIIQFVLVLLLLCSLPMWKNYDNRSNECVKVPEDIGKGQGLFELLRKNGAPLVMITFFLYTAIEASMMLWGSSYLVNIKRVTPENAAGWVSLFFGGITFGRMLSGFFSIKLKDRILIRIGCIFIITGVIILIFSQSTPFIISAYIIIGIGLAPIYPSMLHQTPSYFGKQNAQEAMGLQMAFAYTGTTLIPPLLGQFFANISFILMPYIFLGCGIVLLACTERLRMITKANGSFD